MFGSNVDNIITGLNRVKEAAAASVSALASPTGQNIDTTGVHGETEIPKPSPASAYMTPIATAMSALSSDFGNMNTLKNSHFISIDSWHTSSGSPWVEIENLQLVFNNAQAYAGAHAPLNFVGDKAGMLAHINAIMTAAVDAKWAIAVYHDYIQRGYDSVVNGNEKDIAWEDGSGNPSTGNITQAYDENANVSQPVENNAYTPA